MCARSVAILQTQGSICTISLTGRPRSRQVRLNWLARIFERLGRVWLELPIKCGCTVARECSVHCAKPNTAFAPRDSLNTDAKGIDQGFVEH